MTRLPHITIYTDNLPVGAGGCANGPVIRIQPKRRGDEGLLLHELEHVKQWYVMLGVGLLLALALVLLGHSEYWPHAAMLGVVLHPLAYVGIPRHRLWCEVQAYRVQAAAYADDRRALFAVFLSRDYGLDLSVSDALKELQ